MCAASVLRGAAGDRIGLAPALGERGELRVERGGVLGWRRGRSCSSSLRELARSRACARGQRWRAARRGSACALGGGVGERARRARRPAPIWSAMPRADRRPAVRRRRRRSPSACRPASASCARLASIVRDSDARRCARGWPPRRASPRAVAPKRRASARLVRMREQPEDADQRGTARTARRRTAPARPAPASASASRASHSIAPIQASATSDRERRQRASRRRAARPRRRHRVRRGRSPRSPEHRAVAADRAAVGGRGGSAALLVSARISTIIEPPFMPRCLPCFGARQSE